MVMLPLLTTRWGRLLCVLALLAIAYDQADAASAHEDDRLWQTVSEDRLDTLRGGFDVGGLLVSFGISRAVYLNGALLTETTLNLGQLGNLSPAQAAQLNAQVAGVNMVKIGPGNTAALDGGALAAGVAGAMPGVVVQNTLNNQNISVQTMIHATSNSLGILRGMNASRTLGDALR
ncbi:MAG: hypothetical protein JWQ88_2848 [Rhodoferax sp.]|nr:hypothetical protein [Rhodoferax sp.]